MKLLSLLIACCVLGGNAAFAAAPQTQPADPRPNIFFAIADDWSWPHAGIYGDTVVQTPTFDRIAKEGMLFSNSYCVSASCTPSRASILTGQFPHRLESGANLWSTLPAKFPVYPDLLEAQGYVVGYLGKGWAPGFLGDRTRNPAGPVFKSFEAFLKSVPPGRPWCFWYGSHDPHRPYKDGQGAASGIKLDAIKVPPFLPDVPEVRGDIADYYFAVQRFDRDTGAMMKQIEEAGQLDHTIVVMTSDNGFPFPRAKANCYEYSNHMPLAIRWGEKVKPGSKSDAIISHVDFAPTFLDAALQFRGPSAIQKSATLADLSRDMNGHSFLPVLLGQTDGVARDHAFIERERHANVRKGDASYPMRGVRVGKFLYISNLRPDLWPAGDPEMWKAVGPFGDIDGGPSKTFLLHHKDDEGIGHLFELACGKRPAEELYDLEQDPYALHDVSGYPEYDKDLQKLRAQTKDWMTRTNDPRATAGGAYDAFDKYPYTGGRDTKALGTPATRPARAKGGRNPPRTP